jgi:hypothetical protein
MNEITPGAAMSERRGMKVEHEPLETRKCPSTDNWSSGHDSDVFSVRRSLTHGGPTRVGRPSLVADRRVAFSIGARRSSAT